MRRITKTKVRRPRKCPFCDHNARVSCVIIQDLTILAKARLTALRDLLAFYDRVAEYAAKPSHRDGWTTADVQRIEEVRKLCKS